MTDEDLRVFFFAQALRCDRDERISDVDLDRPHVKGELRASFSDQLLGLRL